MGRGSSKAGGGGSKVGGGLSKDDRDKITQGILNHTESENDGAAKNYENWIAREKQTLANMDKAIKVGALSANDPRVASHKDTLDALEKQYAFFKTERKRIAGDKLNTQIKTLEQTWGGSGKALTPDKVKVGDRIEGVQYTFKPDVLKATQKKGSWSGTYQGNKMQFSANNTFQVTAVKNTKKGVEITADKIGGAGGTVKKVIPKDTYLKVFKKKK